VGISERLEPVYVEIAALQLFLHDKQIGVVLLLPLHQHAQEFPQLGRSARASQSLYDLGIGILAVEEADPDAERFVVTMSEDADCSGLPVLDDTICTYDEGFIAALLESFSGNSYVVREVDCWASGARTCRFIAQACQE